MRVCFDKVTNMLLIGGCASRVCCLINSGVNRCTRERS